MPPIELVPRSSLTTLKWWSSLTPAEQRIVLTETQSATEEMVKFGMARLAIGEHLAKLREVLEPKRIFVRFLRMQFRFSRATAYRYIDLYLQARDSMPEPVLRTAIARGFDVIEPRILKRLPPPHTQARAKILQYLDKVDQVIRRDRARAEAQEPEYDRDTLLREALNFAVMRYNRLPADNRGRARWREQFIGMFLSEAGVDEQTRFAPVPVPENLRVLHGRPPGKAAA